MHARYNVISQKLNLCELDTHAEFLSNGCTRTFLHDVSMQQPAIVGFSEYGSVILSAIKNRP